MGTRSITILPHVARTANTDSAEVNARSCDAVTFDINVTALTGTSVTFTIHYYDPNTATWVTTGLASTAISAAGRQRLTIGVASPATANVSQHGVPPPQMRVTTTGTWNPATFSVTAQLHS